MSYRNASIAFILVISFLIQSKPAHAQTSPFSITNLGGVSTSSDGAGAQSIGHSRIETSSGTTPSGIAIFGYSQGGVLVTEAGVPDSPLVTAWRVYGEVSGGGVVNTGLAISNPNAQPVGIAFTVLDGTGAVIDLSSTTIAANSQLASFLTDAPYSIAGAFQGTLSFSSTLPVGVIALRSFVNERSDF